MVLEHTRHNLSYELEDSLVRAEGNVWGNSSKILQEAIYDLLNERPVHVHIYLTLKQLVNLIGVGLSQVYHFNPRDQREL